MGDGPGTELALVPDSDAIEDLGFQVGLRTLQFVQFAFWRKCEHGNQGLADFQQTNHCH